MNTGSGVLILILGILAAAPTTCHAADSSAPAASSSVPGTDASSSTGTTSPITPPPVTGPGAITIPSQDDTDSADDTRPALPTAGALLWQARTLTGDQASRDSFLMGPGSTAALEDPAGLAIGGLNLDGLTLTGVSTPDPRAALRRRYTAGFAWQQGSVTLGDSRMQMIGNPLAILDRTLQGVSTDISVHPGAFSISVGAARLISRHVVLRGADRAGPYLVGASAPILPESVSVHVDGQAVPAGEYTLDQAVGILHFQTLISSLSTIDVRYEQAGDGGPMDGDVVGASFAVMPATRRQNPIDQAGSNGQTLQAGLALMRVTMVRDPGAAATINGPAAITEGPFLSDGMPMTIPLGPGYPSTILQVTADGIPLTAGRDYTASLSDRLLYITRSLPAGSVVQVQCRVSPGHISQNGGTVLGLDGLQPLGASTGIRWVTAHSDHGSALSSALATGLDGGRLALGARLSLQDNGFASPAGQADSRRWSGVQSGLSYVNGARFAVAATAAAGRAVLAAPDLDTPAAGLPGIGTQSIQVSGSALPTSRVSGSWDLLAARVGGRPCSLAHASLGLRDPGWTIAAELDHRTASPGQALESMVAQTTPSLPAIPLRSASINDTLAQVSAHGHSGTWLDGGLMLARGWMAGSTSGQYVRAHLSVSPTSRVELAAQFEGQSTESSEHAGALAAGAAMLNAARSDLDVAELARDVAASGGGADAKAERAGPGSPRPGSGGQSPQGGPAGPTLPDSQPHPGAGSQASLSGLPETTSFLPTSAGSGIAPGYLFRDVTGASTFTGSDLTAGMPVSANLDVSLTWQLRSDLGVSLDYEDLSARFDTAPSERQQTSSIICRMGEPGLALRPGMIRGAIRIGRGLLSANTTAPTGEARSASGTSWSGLAQVEGSPCRRWSLGLTLQRGFSRSAPPIALGTSAAPAWSGMLTSASLRAARSLAGGRVAFVEGSIRESGGEGGFGVQTASAGIIINLPAQLGIEIRGQQSRLYGPAVIRCSSSALLISLVSR